MARMFRRYLAPPPPSGSRAYGIFLAKHEYLYRVDVDIKQVFSVETSTSNITRWNYIDSPDLEPAIITNNVTYLANREAFLIEVRGPAQIINTITCYYGTNTGSLFGPRSRFECELVAWGEI